MASRQERIFSSVGNLDVCVTFADGQECTFVFATPANLVTMMEKDGTPYLEPGLPFLFVRVPSWGSTSLSGVG